MEFSEWVESYELPFGLERHRRREFGRFSPFIESDNLPWLKSFTICRVIWYTRTRHQTPFGWWQTIELAIGRRGSWMYSLGTVPDKPFRFAASFEGMRHKGEAWPGASR